jgi:hypothetical protein
MATARTVWVASALVMTSPPSRGPNRPPPGASTPDMVSSYERRATVLRRWAIPSACGPSTCSTARGIDRQGPQPPAPPPAADHGLSPAQADHAGVVPADTRRAQSRPPPREGERPLWAPCVRVIRSCQRTVVCCQAWDWRSGVRYLNPAKVMYLSATSGLWDTDLPTPRDQARTPFLPDSASGRANWMRRGRLRQDAPRGVEGADDITPSRS